MKRTKQRSVNTYFKRSTLSLATFLFCQSGIAQNTETDDDVMVEEIVVTARLIEEDIQDIPLSVSALTASEIQKRGIDNLTEIARTTPNFAYEDFNGAIAAPVIRGQSQNRLTNPIQNVATFIDGVYIQRGYMIDASMLNIGQVEVVRGPQVAAFGRNAFGGAISYKHKELGDEFSGSITAAAGENEYQRLDVTAELPFSESFGILLGYTSK